MKCFTSYQRLNKALSQEPNGYVNIAKDLIDDEEDFIFYQEPCEDVVSRDAVIKAVDAHTNEDGTLDDDISVILEDLPSVTQKSGKWIKGKDEYGTNHFTCPFCGHDIATKAENWDDNYCANCGADLRGAE